MRRSYTLFLAVMAIALPRFASAQCGTYPSSGTVSITTANNILNSYYPGQGDPTAGSASITVGARDTRGATNVIAPGDLVLLIQMQGAAINATNTSSYGSGTSGVGSGYLVNSDLVAGYYEYNTVLSVSGSTINFSYPLANNYYTRAFADGSIRTYQVIRVPKYYALSISAAGSVTAPSWNGATGGMVVLDAANIMTINGTITVSGLGFRGGGGKNFQGGSGTTNTAYRFNSAVTTATILTGGAKGEGIAGRGAYVFVTGATTVTTLSDEGYTNGSMGRGAPGTAGGGGTDGTPSTNAYNTGGGGGGNGGAGGRGGSGWHGGTGDVNSYPTGGFGGAAFAQASLGRIVMGSGGGAGTANNSSTANEYMCSGSPGGGIILLRASSYAGSGTISANGQAAPGVSGTGNTDAAGGGGAGGTILVVTTQSGAAGLGSITATAIGGKGGDMTNYYDHGPGGGGGGGVIITNGSFGTTNVAAGANGLTRTGSSSGELNNAYGSTPGAVGRVITLTGVPSLGNAGSPSSPCGTLPVSLTSFNAVLNADQVTLYWKLEQALSFSHTTVEYSSDGINFVPLGNVAYAPSQISYSYVHYGVTAPVNYYRLKLVDIDGTFRYSYVLPVRLQVKGAGLLLHPAPAQAYTNVTFSASRAQQTDLQLFSADGRLVKTRTVQVQRGQQTFVLNELDKLQPGVYLFKALIDGETVSAKLVITR